MPADTLEGTDSEVPNLTVGSITKPSARAGIYGMKVTVGLISCEGIVSVK